MIWDRRTRRYVQDNGRVIHPSQVRKRIERYIAHEQSLITARARRVIVGEKYVSEFFAEMAAKIRQWHSAAGVMAYGGESEMSWERWARIEAKIQSELEYLAAFEAEMQKRAIDAEVTEALVSRSKMYAESAYATYENNVMAREFDSGVTMGRRVSEEDDASCEECVAAASTYYSDLADIPEIGSLQCLTNCRCYIEYAEPVTGFGVGDFSEEVQTQIYEAGLVG